MEEVEMLEKFIEVMQERGYFSDDPITASFQRLRVYNMDPYILADLIE